MIVYRVYECLDIFNVSGMSMNVIFTLISTIYHSALSFSTISSIWGWVKTLVPLFCSHQNSWVKMDVQPIKNMLFITVVIHSHIIYICSAPRNDQPGIPIFQTAILRWSLRWPRRNETSRLIFLRPDPWPKMTQDDPNSILMISLWYPYDILWSLSLQDLGILGISCANCLGKLVKIWQALKLSVPLDLDPDPNW